MKIPEKGAVGRVLVLSEKGGEFTEFLNPLLEWRLLCRLKEGETPFLHTPDIEDQLLIEFPNVIEGRHVFIAPFIRGDLRSLNTSLAI
jgi:hypothetical protein